MGRQVTRRPAIWQDPEGTKPRLWHSWLTVGRRADGKPKRRHIKGATRERVEELLDEAVAAIDRRGGSAATVETVAEWMRHWLEHIVRPRRAYNTWIGYRTIAELHVIPLIGDRRVAGNRGRLEPEHLDRMYTELAAKGLAASYVTQIHLVLSACLKAGVRRGRVARNVCEMVEKPTFRRTRVRAHNLETAQKIIQTAIEDDLAPRWLVAILYGPRQGEVLGIHWRGDDTVSRLDLDADPAMLYLVKQVQRRSWQHGCADAVRCVRQMDPQPCRTRPCPPRYAHGCADESACRKLAHFCPARRQVDGCSRHRSAKGCPPPCAPRCDRHAAKCPARTGGGLMEVDLKSERSVREFPIVGALVDLLVAHRERQQQLCDQLSVEWDPHGLVFATSAGKPLDPRRDHEAWERVLQRAGVADAPLHGARHDAASLLVATGTDISIVQEILGHTDIRTTRQYVEIANDIKKQAVDRVAAALFDGALAALLQPSSATTPRQR